MKVNIYYGGRGILDDPTSYVIDRMAAVFSELRVEVNRINIYEYADNIYTLPQTMVGVDGVVLATTVEWLGIGGYMSQFLDAIWLYGDRDSISNIYMQPIVMSSTYGEREGLITLENAWDMLGGRLCEGMSGYVEDIVSFQKNRDYHKIIEKKAENLYRTISQKTASLPTSNQAVTRTLLRTMEPSLSPRERQQLSKYASDDGYVKKQKQDIKELSNIYRNMIQTEGAGEDKEYIMELRSKFRPANGFEASYSFVIEGKETPLFVRVRGDNIECIYEDRGDADVIIRASKEIFDDIMIGKITFQRAFAVGDITSKGDFVILKMLDELFK